jgi:hypothetical protein
MVASASGLDLKGPILTQERPTTAANSADLPEPSTVPTLVAASTSEVLDTLRAGPNSFSLTTTTPGSTGFETNCPHMKYRIFATARNIRAIFMMVL